LFCNVTEAVLTVLPSHSFLSSVIFSIVRSLISSHYAGAFGQSLLSTTFLGLTLLPICLIVLIGPNS
jgi:hypothetical protein